MPLVHEKYNPDNRKFIVTDEKGKPTGQKALKAGPGQVNVLDGKEYKPFIWDAEHQVCKFNNYEIRLTASGIEIYKGQDKLISLGAHPEIEKELTAAEFERKEAVVSGLSTRVIDDGGCAERIEISYDVETDNLKTRLSFEVGGKREVVFGIENTAKVLDKLQRCTIECDQEAVLEEVIFGNLESQKYRFKNGSYWKWLPSENAEHKVTLTKDKTEIHLKEQVYTSISPVSIKPDTWGPGTVADADDGFEHNNTTWYDDNSGSIYIGDYGGAADLDAGFMWTVTDADLPGATLNAGCDIEITSAGIYNGGSDGHLSIVDDRSPGTWGSSNRPSQQTLHSSNVTWNNSSTGTITSAELNSFIQQRIDGDDAAAFESGDKIAIIWFSDEATSDGETYWSEGVGDLTIVYTPSGGTTLVVAAAGSAGTLDNVALTQAHTLTVQALSGAGALDNVIINTTTILVVAELLSSGALDNTELTQAHILAIQTLQSSGALDNTELTQAHILAIQALQSSGTLDNVIVSISTILVVAELLSSGALDNTELTQAHILAIQTLQSSGALDNVYLGEPLFTDAQIAEIKRIHRNAMIVDGYF